MSNPNARDSYNQEVRQDSYQDANGNTHTNVTRTTETVHNNKVEPQRESYRDGYFQGRVAERSQQEEDLTVRDNDNAARGLLLGIILTTLAALTAGAFWFFNQNQETTPVTQPVVVPVAKDKPDSKPSPANNQTSKTTIIEKIKEVPVPVAQPQTPASAPQQNVDINIPTPAPQQSQTNQAAPVETKPSQPESQSSSTSTKDTQTDTTSNTATQEPVSETNTSSSGESSQSDTTDSSSSQ